MSRPNRAEIEAAKTPDGGWTRETLAGWGIEWPPKKGWKRAMMYPDEQIEGEFKPTTIGQAAIRTLPRLEIAALVSRYTESPIETMLAVAILCQWHDVELRLPGEAWAPDWTLVPQYPWGRYRVDLALRRPQGEVIFIECDGQEFHSSPEQVARDQSREQEMKAAGFPVVRFSGSEINYSAVACVSQLSRFRWGWGRR